MMSIDAKDLKPGDWTARALERGERIRVEALQAESAAEVIAHTIADPRARLSTTLTTLTEYTDKTHVGMPLWTQDYEPLLTVSGQSHGEHDLQLEACTRFVNEHVCGTCAPVACHDNFAKAVAQIGLPEKWVPYPLGIFRRCGTVEGRFQILPAASEVGDYLELVAEVDVTVAVSACPVGVWPRYRDISTIRVGWRRT